MSKRCKGTLPRVLRDSIKPETSNRKLYSPVLSSAARMPLPGATMRLAMSRSSAFCSSLRYCGNRCDGILAETRMWLLVTGGRGGGGRETGSVNESCIMRKAEPKARGRQLEQQSDQKKQRGSDAKLLLYYSFTPGEATGQFLTKCHLTLGLTSFCHATLN